MIGLGSDKNECNNLDIWSGKTPLILSIWWTLVIWKSAWDFDILKFTVCWPSLASISAHLLIVCHYLSSSVLLALCSLLTGSVSWPTPSVWTSHRRHSQTDSLHTQCSRDVQHRNTNIKHTLKNLNLNILLTPLSDTEVDYSILHRQKAMEIVKSTTSYICHKFYSLWPEWYLTTCGYNLN